jgi:hypothetical protein
VQYVWTKEIDAELRLAYAGGRGAVSAAFDRLAKRTGWRRAAFSARAVKIGAATTGQYRKWTAAEDAYIRERAGTVSVRAIAAKLGRTRLATAGRMERLKVSRRPSEGYCVSDLMGAMGVSYSFIVSKLKRGLFGKVHRNGGLRASEENVVRFLREHWREYDLRRVDQDWYKAMVFGDRA